MKTTLKQQRILEGILDHMAILSNQKWTEDAYGNIRNEHDQCPLAALADEIAPFDNGYKRSSHDTAQFGNVLLGEPAVCYTDSDWNAIALPIIHAADNYLRDENPECLEIKQQLRAVLNVA